MALSGQNLPPPQSPFVDVKSGILSNDGYQFLMNLINQIAQAIPTASVTQGILLTGSTQATAAPLQSQWSEIAGQQGSGTWALLASYQAGQSQVVVNSSGVNANIYPPPGASINGGPQNVPITVAPDTLTVFRFISATDIWT